MLEVRQVMEIYTIRYLQLFLDEITEVTDFQKYGNTLSDYFSAKGAKLLLLEQIH